jgi:anti-sigma factor RsiW
MQWWEKMDCNESQSMMSAYVDGELDVADTIRYESHLAKCPACTGACEKLMSLRTALKTHAVSYAASEQVRQRVLTALHENQARSNSVAKSTAWAWAWLNPAVAAVCSVAFAFALALYMRTPSESERLVQEIVASHYRSQLANHLVDVASSDRHTVKPWFNGKLDFSPPVIDLAAQGFPLIGGRLDYVNRRTVAALAYQRRLHIVNLFMWPDRTPGNSPPEARSLQGFHLLHWTDSEMAYWAISDMAPKELNTFKDSLMSQIGKNKDIK